MAFPWLDMQNPALVNRLPVRVKIDFPGQKNLNGINVRVPMARGCGFRFT